MKQEKKRIRNQERSTEKTSRIRKTRFKRIMLAIILPAVCAAVTFAVRAYNNHSAMTIPVITPLPANHIESAPPPQTGPQINNRQTRLSLQPQADRMRMKLGSRFRSPGKEVAYLSGTLRINSQTHELRLIHSQAEDDESVTVALNGGTSLFSWDRKEGAKSAGNTLSGELKAVVERIALDSPDQFILAQLRGASYYTVATGVVPEEAASSQSYDGPVWDVVRVDEPDRANLSKTESLWRMYYINVQTGLLERIISNEQGDTVMAELIEWSEQGGEMVPGRIRWSRNKQVFMEIVFSGLSYSAR